ncbi:hypothetical protein [Saccharopolyspora taberi]|uniref:Secreted protein n=1 Tax=Saccharopolyspora taberi TaxID=60895 RepID=A0ABN3VKE3_9PSEU
MNLTHKLAVAGAAAFTLIGAGTAVALASGEDSAVRDCAGQSLVRPSEIVLTCADGNAVVRGIDWDSWGSAQASGLGTAEINDCEPSCADGESRPERVRVTLDAPVGSVFTRAVLDNGEEFALPGAAR